MKIENVRPTPVDMAPAEEERKVELPGKKKSHERKLKRKFEKKIKTAKAVGKKAKHIAKRARHAQHNAERERDTVAAENALLQKCLESKDKDVTDALRDENGFIRLRERNGKND